jgi:hypothetical protein
VDGVSALEYKTTKKLTQNIAAVAINGSTDVPTTI